jgi:hypothetical protein
MSDFIVLLLIYVFFSVIAFWSVQSLFQKIELEDELEISLKIKIRLALIFSAMYLLPLLFVKPVGLVSLLLYFLTIPLSIIAIQKIAKNSMPLKSAIAVFLGISGKFIVVLIVLGIIVRLLLKAIKEINQV